jgi:hypothetical protein
MDHSDGGVPCPFVVRNGARVGSVGGGVWAGGIEPILTETERERLNRLEAAINDLMIDRALDIAPSK